MNEIIKRYENLLIQKRYSKNTVNSYCNYFKIFVCISEMKIWKRLQHLLRQYYKEYKPKKYLFEGQAGGKYSPTSVANILKKAALRAGIKKTVTPLINVNYYFALAAIKIPVFLDI